MPLQVFARGEGGSNNGQRPLTEKAVLGGTVGTCWGELETRRGCARVEEGLHLSTLLFARVAWR